MYSVSKNFRFESSHRLVKGYSGKCSNLHGHSWNGRIDVAIPALDDKDMSIDFSILGDFCKSVEKSFDHKTIVFEEDFELIEFLKNQKSSFITVDANPTCETLSRVIHDMFTDFINSTDIVGVEPLKIRVLIKTFSVTIEETCTTSCTYAR